MRADQMDIYLGFHGIGTPGRHVPDSERPYWVPADRYRAILDIVAHAPNKVGITFDDGNASDIELGLPTLQEYGLSAGFFVVSERIGASGYLSAEDIRALDKTGMEVGAHGVSHVMWTGLPDDLMTHHVTSSLTVLSRVLGKRIDSVSVPFGSYDRRVLTVLRRARVNRVYTSDRGPAVEGSWVVPRNTIRIDKTLAEIKAMVSKPLSTADRLKARANLLRRSLRRQPLGPPDNV